MTWRRSAFVQKTARRVIATIVPLVFLLAWQFASTLRLIPDSYNAGPLSVAATLWSLLFDGHLLTHIGISTGRLLVGIFAGVLFGTLGGVLLASSRTLEDVTGPTIQFGAAVPVVVWMPFWIMVVGPGEVFKIGLLATAVFFVVELHVLRAMRTTSLKFIEVANMYELATPLRWRYVYVPAIGGAVLTATRVAVALGWIVLFFSEYAAARETTGGLGWFVADARHTGRVEDEYAGMVALAIIGFAADKMLASIQQRAARWDTTAETHD